MNVTALIPAAGSGRRMGGTLEKQFLQLGGKPLLTHTLARFEETPGVHQVVVIVPPGREEFCRLEVIERQGFRKVRCIVAGAETRQGSVGAGLRCVGEDVEIVVVHDGVRPFVTPALIQASIDAAAREGGAIVAIPEADTLKRASAEGLVVETVDRRHLWRAQTPQAFRREVLQRALDHAEQHHIAGTDEASLVECLSRPVRIVMGSSWNLKITSPDDLKLAEFLLVHYTAGGLLSTAAVEGA